MVISFQGDIAFSSAKLLRDYSYHFIGLARGGGWEHTVPGFDRVLKTTELKTLAWKTLHDCRGLVFCATVLMIRTGAHGKKPKGLIYNMPNVWEKNWQLGGGTFLLDTHITKWYVVSSNFLSQCDIIKSVWLSLWTIKNLSLFVIILGRHKSRWPSFWESP